MMKHAKKNCLSYFGINISENNPLRFWKIVVILSVIPTVSCSAERALNIFQRPKIDQKHHGIGSLQSSGTTIIIIIDLFQFGL